MPSSTAQGCPNSWQEQNGCIIFHLPLTLPCESFLPRTLTDSSRALQKSDLAATTNHTILPGSSQTKGCGSFQWRGLETAYLEPRQGKHKDT